MMISMLLIQLFCSIFLTGVMWIKQLVSYPTMTLIEVDGFVKYENERQRRMNWILYPIMGTELFTALVLSTQSQWEFKANLVSLIILWIISLNINIPQLRKLRKSKENEVIFNMCKINWFKTLLWTAKSILLLTI